MITTQNNPKIRCRFAPSPTGDLHVGGARTALFNYLFAKSSGGTFVLRIEDTDRERSTTEALDAILDGLKWLDLSPDEGPYFQSERGEIYQDYAKRLLESGHAYPCSCTQERLQELRDAQKKAGKTPRYDELHRPTDITPQPIALPTGEEEEPFVIRLRTPNEGASVFNDLILEEISTPNQEIDDFIIIRSDGSPTYNFVVVVDDLDMKMSHVIRGMDHITNTSKQLVIYHALGAEPPLFAHVPMIHGPDKKKLSKRHGATSVVEYEKMGYLSDAFVNYLARLGWSHGDKEIFSREELESLFTLENVGRSPSVFDMTKLLWVNAEHIKTAPAETLAKHAEKILAAQGFNANKLHLNEDFLKLIDVLRPRAKTLPELADACKWFVSEDKDLTFDQKAAKKHLKADIRIPLATLIEKVQEMDSFTEQDLEPVFQEIVEVFGIKLGQLAQAVRVSLTGTSVSPPIYDVLSILGKNSSIERLKMGLCQIPDE